ncbi:MAG: hypothetical protein ACLS90_05910 [Clostridia bacterium]
MFKDKLKEIVKPEENKENNKKKTENLIFFIILLIITIIIINIVWNGDKDSSNKQDSNSTNSKQLAKENESVVDASTNTTNELESKLENILSKIQGVGEVNVFINYSESSEIVPMYNENKKTSNTQETDTSGGTRVTQQEDSQKEIIYEEKNNTKSPITQRVVEPKIEGAIITAKGASNADVKTNIIQAVEAATGLATHKIQVFEKN